MIEHCSPQEMMALQAAGATDRFIDLMTCTDELFVDGRTLLALEGAPPATNECGTQIAPPELPWVCVRWAAFSAPFPVWYRDFVYIEANLRVGDEWWVSCGASVQHPSFPSLESLKCVHYCVRRGCVGCVDWRTPQVRPRPNLPHRLRLAQLA